MWRELGRESDVIGTLTHERTTPAPPELYRELDRVALSSATRPLVGIEVSSHALSQGRVDGLIFDVAAFTNLSQDHLDYHGTMERYFAAKSSLFVPERCRHGVIWIDDEYGRRLATMTGVPVTTVQRTEATHVEMSLGATNFTWRGRRAHSGLSGQYNLDNVLVVLACALELGLSESDAVDALAGVPAVAGRFDVVATSSPTVIVDYAHTPDGLERLLRDVRSLSARRRLVVVFGCGGDRDRSKRPVMGEIVTRLADEVIVTSDNPRNEDPNAIIDEIVVGCTGPAPWRRVVDRRLAIGEAISTAGDDDVVVIAGKGHERTQTIGSTVLEFDDRVVAREYVR
jgi:UDP-N-acetylmuramoyl-L-alanyl-D-glutamate--2,6-diaminopimelate ligase